MADAKSSAGTSWLAAALVAASAVGLVTLADEWSRERIAANERARLVARLQSVLDPTLLGRDVRIVAVEISDSAPLQSEALVNAFVALVDGRPTATVLANVAPYGYNGPIDLLVGIDDRGTVTGARAIRHRETPGLGATIDADDGAWFRQFAGKTLTDPPTETWTVKQDDGAFDALSGATVTSRTVTAALRNALLYFAQHRDELYDAALAAPPDDGKTD